MDPGKVEMKKLERTSLRKSARQVQGCHWRGLFLGGIKDSFTDVRVFKFFPKCICRVIDIFLVFLGGIVATISKPRELKGIQLFKINFCIQFTYLILGIDVFAKKDFDIMLTLFLSV